MRALYVATDLRDADVLQQEVRRAAPKLTFDVCSGTTEARARIEGTLSTDVMILDSSLPEHEQQQMIEHVRSRQIPLPIVILVGQGATPSSAIVSAADECITRGPRLAERLAPGLRMAMERYRVVATVSRENERLKRSEARLRLIIEAMPAGVVLVDQAGRIQAMNLAGASLVGVGGPSDVVGRELYSLADHDGIQALRDLVTRAFDGTRGTANFTCHSPGGELRPLQIEALCIQKVALGQGSVLGVLTAGHGETVAAETTLARDESGVDFAFANDQGAEERMALEQALEEVRADASRLQQESESERARVQQVLEELERSRATAAEHHAQRCAAEGRVGALEAQIRDGESTIATLNGKVDQLTTDLAQARSAHPKLQKDLDDVRADLQAQRKLTGENITRAESAEKERNRTRDQLAASEAKAKDLATELKALQTRFDATERNETKLAGELEKVRAEAAKVADALESEGKSRQGAEAALSSTRDSLQSRVAELEAQTKDLETRRQEAVARIAELEEKRRADQSALTDSKKREGELEQQLKTVRDEATRAGSERDGLKSELGRVHESHRAAEDDASLKASEAARAKSELDGRIHQLQGQLDGSHGELERVRGELAGARAEIDGLRTDVERTRAERDAHAGEVDSVKAAIAKATALIEELRGAKDASDARASHLSGELDGLRRDRAVHGHHASDLQQALERERADARARAEMVERDHHEALARLQRQIEEAREFAASSPARTGGAERGRRRPGERLGQLASAMANDLHGIVNGMADEARKLLAELPDGSNVRAQAEQSLQSANRAGQLVRHLLRFSEREQRATSGADPNSIVRANEPMLRQLAGPDIDLRFDLAPSLPPVECDADELAGVLSTLVVTVRGALPLGGTIRLTTTPPRKDGGRRRNDGALALSVVAEGYGMVSVPTTVCDEVVTRSGGTFSAQVDVKGGSTTFTAYLPIDQAADAGVTNIA
jgi:PAS domain S-box-containing protein